MAELTLRERREATGLSLSDVAQRVGISVSTLSRMERDKTKTSRPVQLAVERVIARAEARAA